MRKKKAMELLNEIDELEEIKVEAEEKIRMIIELRDYFKSKEEVSSLPRYIGFMNGAELGLSVLIRSNTNIREEIAEITQKLDEAGYPVDGKMITAKDFVRMM